MNNNYYQTLKKRTEEKRKTEPAPRIVPGTFLPQAVATKQILADEPQMNSGWSKLKMLREAVMIWHRFSWADVIRTAEALGGYEPLILTLEKIQKPGVVEAAKEFRKELGLTSDDMHDMRVVSVAGTVGVGFEIDAGVEHTDEREVGMKYWCPMVQAIRDMGYENSPLIQDFHLWCDLYDNFELAATNEKMNFCHTHCLARREDSYCRYCVDYHEKLPEENYYEYLVRMREIKRAEADKEAGGDVAALDRPGYASCTTVDKFFGDLSPEEQMKVGVKIQRRIGVATVITGAELLGWEKFINGMNDKEIPRLTERMRNLGQRLNITGTTAVEAAILMNIGMLGSGFDDHQYISWSKDRAEGIATTCPLVESAKESHIEDKFGDNMCLWCTAWHEANASAMSKDIKVTFTHCLGKGDKCCRWVIDKK